MLAAIFTVQIENRSDFCSGKSCVFDVGRVGHGRNIYWNCQMEFWLLLAFFVGNILAVVKVFSVLWAFFLPKYIVEMGPTMKVGGSGTCQHIHPQKKWSSVGKNVMLLPRLLPIVWYIFLIIRLFQKLIFLN